MRLQTSEGWIGLEHPRWLIDMLDVAMDGCVGAPLRIWIREPPSSSTWLLRVSCVPRSMAAGLPEHPQSKCSKREGQNSQNVTSHHIVLIGGVTRSSQPRGEGRWDPPLDVWSHVKEGEKTLGWSLETSYRTAHLVLQPCSPRVLLRRVRSQMGSPERAKSPLRASCRGRGCPPECPCALPPRPLGRGGSSGEQVCNQGAVS